LVSFVTEKASSAVFDSPVGQLYACADEGELVRLSFAGSPSYGEAAQRGDAASREIVDAAASQIREYFEGSRIAFDIPMKLMGSPFYARVWEALRAIPYGTTITYGELAKRVGEPDAARAVGAANGANPIVIIVPCHRVIGANGRLVGYGGGLQRKQFLLDHESGPLLSYRSLRL
jgi:methylated-DNA-[protein]-cysteine S-methyltransferase